ncbi:hypothetical protein HDA43_006860 [Streptosporangium sandarakinum]|uniref:Uncharacterized protein n=1 Tax=Streptosporangium sandarakinum TaxID=1260955 RepID=A0A852VAP9_9ACTN|nr:hypothetical protein [Streptosporangium sandarakinum]
MPRKRRRKAANSREGYLLIARAVLIVVDWALRTIRLG